MPCVGFKHINYNQVNSCRINYSCFHYLSLIDLITQKNPNCLYNNGWGLSKSDDYIIFNKSFQMILNYYRINLSYLMHFLFV